MPPRSLLPLAALLASLALAGPADAQPPPAGSMGQQTPAPRPSPAWGGVLVVALDGASAPAGALAQAVYGDGRLRPPSLSDEAARVLWGEAPREGDSQRARDLAELRAAIHGDDAPSRRLLDSLSRETGASLVVVVSAPAERPPEARVFSPSQGRFEASPIASEPPSVPGGPPSWSAALAQLRASAPQPASPGKGSPPAPPEQRPAGTSVVSSGWLWAALGAAAALTVGAVLVARSSNGSGGDTVGLRLKVAR